jgi:double-stranded uracil-DNA glycosylase
VHRPTVDVYERDVDTYLRRDLRTAPAAPAFAAAVPIGGMRLDLGCGPGHMTGELGSPVVAVDAAHAMISRVRATSLRVRADLEALPFRTGAVHGTWASKCFQHVPSPRLPMALSDLHRCMAVGGRLDLVVFEGDSDWTSDDDLPGRSFWDWPRQRLVDVVEGAGFTEAVLDTTERAAALELHVVATRGRSLADTVDAGMRLLVCGLNPSEYSADAGVGYARPGNRFWPAARAAGLVSVERDAVHALREHGIGMTDLVKRPSVSADELTPQEYRQGLGRVERLCAWLRPSAVCLVGLAGWRASVDRRAQPGVQSRTVGGCPLYLAPSTSGRNASSTFDQLVGHFRAAGALADLAP